MYLTGHTIENRAGVNELQMTPVLTILVTSLPMFKMKMMMMMMQC